MMSYFTSSVSIFTSRRRVQILTTSEMTPYFTMTKCNKLFITYLAAQLNAIQALPSSISMIVVKTMLFNTHAQCSVKYKVLNMG